MLLQDEDYAYDVVGNPTEIRDWRLEEEWPDAAKPVSRKVQYDDLNRVKRVDYQYVVGADEWKSPFERELSEAEENRDPRRSQPSPHVAFEHRTLWQSFDYDWLGNQSATDDDAHGFYDGSLGTVTNGGSAKPYQFQGATQTSGTTGGTLSTTYDATGNLTSLTVARGGPCLPAGASCIQSFTYSWDEVGRLVRATRVDGDDSTAPPAADVLAVGREGRRPYAPGGRYPGGASRCWVAGRGVVEARRWRPVRPRPARVPGPPTRS